MQPALGMEVRWGVRLIRGRARRSASDSVTPSGTIFLTGEHPQLSFTQ